MGTCGAVAGLIAALAVERLLQSLLSGLSGVEAVRPLVLAGVVAAVFVVAFGASCIPARRAASVDPMAALRHD